VSVPTARTAVAMIVAALVGLVAGLLTLRMFGEPTPLGGGN
jgi:hypothetical protein